MRNSKVAYRKRKYYSIVEKEAENPCHSAYSSFIDYRDGEGKISIEWWAQQLQRKTFEVCWREERMGARKDAINK